MKNKLAYLGFIGFLGFLAPFSFLSENSFSPHYYFLFFFFFLYAKVIPDELFILHVRMAATRAFFVTLVFGSILLLSVSIFENVHVIRLFFGLSILIPLGTFLINLEIFEHREKKGMQDDTDYSDERI
ncbi:DUF3796 domain-containing protein [Bacillus thuringiensis]|uniref:DUF3796 domain-containing protein n=1 Tax=Bacillus thuringiensis TaxID=1428 RepID=UPI000BF56E53|nr:DUF3796 domain-containing protein [Bacillus thuringiensis]MED3622370.1 DUF3796 domain-containing protein [Bacillus thuringiensis]PER50739.1 hypothetical protein CN486_28565 [Bacillus thuringiensis]PEV70081.1 hypothetical protein CN434_10660 [Bacillus thuringiensis]PEW88495.1 hypothetical protein CN447_20095 [Bacillus thuringiensis]PFA72123.1 hypothetical protein CN400_32335 [Bacillus thuringiensis]